MQYQTCQHLSHGRHAPPSPHCSQDVLGVGGGGLLRSVSSAGRRAGSFACLPSFRVMNFGHQDCRHFLLHTKDPEVASAWSGAPHRPHSAHFTPASRIPELLSLIWKTSLCTGPGCAALSGPTSSSCALVASPISWSVSLISALREWAAAIEGCEGRPSCISPNLPSPWHSLAGGNLLPSLDPCPLGDRFVCLLIASRRSRFSRFVCLLVASRRSRFSRFVCLLIASRRSRFNRFVCLLIASRRSRFSPAGLTPAGVTAAAPPCWSLLTCLSGGCSVSVVGSVCPRSATRSSVCACFSSLLRHASSSVPPHFG